MIFTNARLIFPDGVRDGLELVAEEGKITAIREQTQSGGEGVINLQGNYLAPGFIDLHLSGGTTSLLLTTATAPIEKIIAALNAVRDSTHQPRRRSRPSSAISGVHVEGPFISKAKRGAHREEFIQDPSPASVQQLLDHADVIKRVTIAPEIPGAIEAIKNFQTRGISVSGGHSDAWDEEATAAFERGMRSVTHTFNCMSSARRRGVYRIAGLLEFALSEPQISCELIADGHHVSPTLMKMLYRAKGARGISLVTDATAGAGLPNESKFSLGGLDGVVKDGVCLLGDGKSRARGRT